MATAEALLTAEEYALLSNGRPSELVRGRIVPMNRPFPWHGYICSKVDRIVGAFVEKNDLGWVMTCDAGTITERDPDTVRGPDVAFYSYARLPKGTLPKKGYLDVVPELVFEVRSPSDRPPELLAKALEYLKAGVLVVVVVDTESQSVAVYEVDQPARVLSFTDELSLPSVLPGFRLLIASILE